MNEVPFSKKVLVGFFTYLVVAVIQAVLPGYNPDPIVEQFIAAAVGFAAQWAVKEQERYLKLALMARQRGE